MVRRGVATTTSRRTMLRIRQKRDDAAVRRHPPRFCFHRDFAPDDPAIQAARCRVLHSAVTGRRFDPPDRRAATPAATRASNADDH